MFSPTQKHIEIGIENSSKMKSVFLKNKQQKHKEDEYFSNKHDDDNDNDDKGSNNSRDASDNDDDDNNDKNNDRKLQQFSLLCISSLISLQSSQLRIAFFCSSLIVYESNKSK